jgi:hypothetical protein
MVEEKRSLERPTFPDLTDDCNATMTNMSLLLVMEMLLNFNFIGSMKPIEAPLKCC